MTLEVKYEWSENTISRSRHNIHATARCLSLTVYTDMRVEDLAKLTKRLQKDHEKQIKMENIISVTLLDNSIILREIPDENSK